MVELVLDTGKHYSNHFLGVIKHIGRGPEDIRNPPKKRRNWYKICLLISIADPHSFFADLNPDPGKNLNADPDPDA